MREMAQALLVAGLPTGLVAFALSCNADLPQGSQQAHLRSDTRRWAEMILSENSERRPVALAPRTESRARQRSVASDARPPLEGSVGVVISRNPVLSEHAFRTPTTGEVQAAVADPTLASGFHDGHVETERLSPDQQVVSAIDAELAKTPANATQVTTMLDLMSTSSDPKALEAAIDRVLQALEDPRQRWSAEGDGALLAQGLQNLLGRVGADRERVFRRNPGQLTPDPDAYTELDFQEQQRRAEQLRRQALATLASQRIEALFVLESVDPARRYDGMLGSPLFAMLAHHVRLLRENADAGTATVASTRVQCLLIDMSAVLERDPSRSADVARVAEIRAELDGLVRR